MEDQIAKLPLNLSEPQRLLLICYSSINYSLRNTDLLKIYYSYNLCPFFLEEMFLQQRRLESFIICCSRDHQLVNFLNTNICLPEGFISGRDLLIFSGGFCSLLLKCTLAGKADISFQQRDA